MSTNTTNMARSPFSTAAFAQLVRRLRHTNARYNQIALQFRCRIRPTHHAKRRANRVGLRIDTTKAHACPDKYISTHPLPILDRSADDVAWPDAPQDAYATTEFAVPGDHVAHLGQGGAYMRTVPLRKAEVIRKRRRDGRQRILLRLPPLKLQLNMNYPSDGPFRGPVPGAPRLTPRQLPEDDCGMEDMALGSGSSLSSDESDSLLTPIDVKVYSGLCITIPPRNLKRKLQDTEVDEDVAYSQQPKRFLRARWEDAQK